MDFMPPKKVNDGLPPNLTFDPANGKYRYRNKLTGERPYLSSDREESIKLAKKANKAIELIMARDQIKLPSVQQVVEQYLHKEVPNKPWKDSTRKNVLAKIKVIEEKWGKLLFHQIDRLYIADWLNGRCSTGDTYNKWRELLVDIWEYAISRKIVTFNEAAATLKRSTSKKLPQNQKRRKRLTLEWFWTIHGSAPPYLQIAMEQSLITLQSRNEIVNMKHTDYKDGLLYVIRDKVAAESDMAFIKIEVTEEIDRIRQQSVTSMSKLSIHSPYLVHYKPRSRRRTHINAKPHWTYIMPGYLTKAFAEIRDETDLFNGWPGNEKPTFHEIRSLGARIYRKLGYPEEYIQGLMTHSDPKTTQIYLSNPEQLTPEHFKKVSAGLTLSQVRGLDV